MSFFKITAKSEQRGRKYAYNDGKTGRDRNDCKDHRYGRRTAASVGNGIRGRRAGDGDQQHCRADDPSGKGRQDRH